MPPLIPLGFGLVLGVCVAPAVRQHPRLQTVFAAVDSLPAVWQAAWRGAAQAWPTLPQARGRRLLRLFNPH